MHRTPPSREGITSISTIPECKLLCQPSLAEPRVPTRSGALATGACVAEVCSARNHLSFNHSENARKIAASALHIGMRAAVNHIVRDSVDELVAQLLSVAAVLDWRQQMVLWKEIAEKTPSIALRTQKP